MENTNDDVTHSHNPGEGVAVLPSPYDHTMDRVTEVEEEG